MKEFPCKKSVLISVTSVQSCDVIARHTSQANRNITKGKKTTNKQTKKTQTTPQFFKFVVV